MLRLATSALALALVACLPGVAAAAPSPLDPGQTTPGTVTSGGAEYRYLLYTPTSYVPGRAAPLLVMVHGCQTTAEQELKVTRYNAVAEREGFVVLYPDVDAIGRALPGPANQCWKFPYPPAWARGGSDAGAIADMTHAVMAKLAIDPQRVYLAGISAGGLMAAINAAAYPDLYAAVAIFESSAYADWTCFTTGIGIPAALSAQLAFGQMGPRARVVPIFVMGGDADLAFPAACQAKALEQGLRTNNLVIGGRQDEPVSLVAALVRKQHKPGGYTSTVSTYRDPSGCLIGERWLVHGLAHNWPGGGTDPTFPGDQRAPDGAEASWAFLERYRKTDTAMPCAEAPVPASPPATCPARTVTITLARGARVRSVRATVAGRQVRTRRRGRRVMLTLPSGRKTTVGVVLRVRREGRSRAQVVRRTFARCAM